jgi:hypothetical protein
VLAAPSRREGRAIALWLRCLLDTPFQHRAPNRDVLQLGGVHVEGIGFKHREIRQLAWCDAADLVFGVCSGRGRNRTLRAGASAECSIDSRPRHGEELGEIADGIVAGRVHPTELGLLFFR